MVETKERVADLCRAGVLESGKLGWRIMVVLELALLEAVATQAGN